MGTPFPLRGTSVHFGGDYSAVLNPQEETQQNKTATASTRGTNRNGKFILLF
jgi:hypothetical protein